MYMFIIICLITSITADDYVKSALACDGQTAVLMCSDMETIQIKSAFYGRSEEVTCNEDRNSRAWDLTCSYHPAVVQVAKRCQGKLTHCSFKASFSERVDPCPETPKYLIIRYKCRRVLKMLALVCDYEEAYISCQKGEMIEVVDAFYGRWNKRTCVNERSTNAWNEACYAPNSLGMVRSTCSVAAHRCLINSSKYDDPCPGTPKYLRIDFDCNQKAKRQLFSHGLKEKMDQLLLALCFMLLKFVN